MKRYCLIVLKATVRKTTMCHHQISNNLQPEKLKIHLMKIHLIEIIKTLMLLYSFSYVTVYFAKQNTLYLTLLTIIDLSDICRFDIFLKSQRRTVHLHKVWKESILSKLFLPLFSVEKWTVRRGLYKLVEALTLLTTSRRLGVRAGEHKSSDGRQTFKFPLNFPRAYTPTDAKPFVGSWVFFTRFFASLRSVTFEIVEMFTFPATQFSDFP